ncbi:unnamed protein product [Cunninghamella blakesleeana]
MHNSDFAFLESASIYIYGLAYFIYSIWQCDRFECLKFKKLVSGELKTVLTIIMFLTMSCQFVWDVTMTYIKYKEGYVSNGTEVVVAPFESWSLEHQQLALTTTYVQSMAFSLQVCIYYMLQCFWHYLTNTVAKKDFMGSLEFKFYIVWSLVSMVIYPVLQWYFHEEQDAAETIPSLIYGIQVILSAFLGIRTHYRFKKLIKNAVSTNANTLVINKLGYFSNINLMMIPCLFSYGLTYLIGCFDGLVGKNQIAPNRFANDCLLANGNIMALCLYILFISVFHPRRQFSPHVVGTSQGNNTNDPSTFQSYQKKEMSLTPATTHQQDINKPDHFHHRFSQRVTSFIGQKFNPHGPSKNEDDKHIVNMAPTESFQQTFNDSGIKSSSSSMIKHHHHQPFSPTSDKPFMRPMSPMSVDYPPSSLNDTIPLTETSTIDHHPPHSPPPHHHQQYTPFYVSSPLPDTPDQYNQYQDPLSPTEASDLHQSEWLRRSPDRRNQ